MEIVEQLITFVKFNHRSHFRNFKDRHFVWPAVSSTDVEREAILDVKWGEAASEYALNE